MIDFVQLEDTLFDVVQLSTGFPDERIIFDDQDGVSPQPQAYATIHMGDLLKLGQDARIWDYDVARAQGVEIRRRTVGVRDFSVTFQFFTPEVVGAATARTIAAKLEADLSLVSFRELLNAAGLGLLQTGDVQWVPKLNNTDFEGRAVLAVRFCVPQGSVDFTGYFDRVAITPTLNGVVKPDIIIPES